MSKPIGRKLDACLCGDTVYLSVLFGGIDPVNEQERAGPASIEAQAFCVGCHRMSRMKAWYRSIKDRTEKFEALGGYAGFLDRVWHLFCCKFDHREGLGK